MWPIVSSQQYINTTRKILLVMLTLKSIRIMNACDTKQKRWWFSIQIVNRKQQRYIRLRSLMFKAVTYWCN